MYSQLELDEHSDKISDENKEKIEAALEKVKKLHDEENIDELDDAMEELNNAWSEASQEIYQSAAQGQGQPGPGAAGAGPAGAGAAAGAGAQDGAQADDSDDEGDDAVDADFEVVDDDDKG